MSKLAEATAAIEPDKTWKLYNKGNHNELHEGDRVAWNGRHGYNISAIDSRARRVYVLGDGTNDSPRTATAESIGALWREVATP